MQVREYKYADWFILYGNGDFAHFEAYDDYQKDSGEFFVRFFITPTQEMIDKYELKVGEEISERNGLVEMHYPKSYVHFLRISSEITRVVVDLDLLGNQTEFSMVSMALKEKVRIYEKQMRQMNIQNHNLEKDNARIMNRQEEQLKRSKRMLDALKDRGGGTETNFDGIPTRPPNMGGSA